MRVRSRLSGLVLLGGLLPGVAGAQVPGQLPPQPDVPPPQLGMPATPAGTVVELRSRDFNATLFRLSGSERRWAWGRYRPVLRRYNLWDPVCRVPCGIAVHPGDLYSIRGLRLVPSAPFMLPQSGVVSLEVDAGHRGPRAGGIVLTTFGGLTMVPGIVFTAIGAGSGDPNMLLGGGITLGVGTVMLIGGITMLVLSRTTVRTADGYRLAAQSRPPRLAWTAAGLTF